MTEKADTSLVFEGRLSEDDVVHLRNVVDLLMVRRSIRIFAGIVLSLLSIGIIAAMMSGGPSTTGILILGLFVYLLFGLRAERRYMARRHYRKHQDQYLTCRVVLDAEAVAISSDAFSSQYKWNFVKGVISTSKGLVFMSDWNHVMFYLPDRAFTPSASREQVVALARDRGAVVRSLPI